MVLTTSVKFKNETIAARLTFQKNNQYLIEFVDSNLLPIILNGVVNVGKFKGTANDKKISCSIIHNENKLFVFSKNERCILELPFIEIGNIQDINVGAKSPMPGRVVEVFVQEGQEIEKGELICIMEAMKMRHEIRSIKKGVIESVLYESGDFVESDQLIVEIKDVV